MTTAFERLNAMVRKKYPNYSDAWERARAEFGGPWETEFSDAIVRLFGEDDAAWQPAVDGYATFCTDALRSQIFFERNGRYKASSYAEVAEACYHNQDFMFRAYLPGMFLSHFVWPHHHKMLRWFRSQMATIDVATFSEVGTGCGMYSADPLRIFSGARGLGFDISPHALKFTERVVEAFGHDDRYGIKVQDIVANPPEPVDLVICQEVLEHIEDPAAFCKALFKMTRPGGHAYITAAINAGHVDHIYLYRSVEQVIDHIGAAGFEIIASHGELAYTGKPVEITPCLGGALGRRPS